MKKSYQNTPENQDLKKNLKKISLFEVRFSFPDGYIGIEHKNQQRYRNRKQIGNRKNHCWEINMKVPANIPKGSDCVFISGKSRKRNARVQVRVKLFIKPQGIITK